MVEGAPIFDVSETNSSGESDKDKKKKRKSFLELVTTESKDREKDRDEDKKIERSWFNRPDAEAEKPAETEIVSSDEAPDEEVGEAEKPVVEKQLVEIIREEEAGVEADAVTDPPVEHFRELIEGGTDSEAAYEEVISELGGDVLEADAAEADRVVPVVSARTLFRLRRPPLPTMSGPTITIGSMTVPARPPWRWPAV
jgi:hypothetical protein